jgi:hypothetical protein
MKNGIHLDPKKGILGLKLDKIGWKLVYLDGNQVFMDW